MQSNDVHHVIRPARHVRSQAGWIKGDPVVVLFLIGSACFRTGVEDEMS
jgi:hypothetical protein